MCSSTNHIGFPLDTPFVLLFGEESSSSSLDCNGVRKLSSKEDDDEEREDGVFLLFFLFRSLASFFTCICIAWLDGYHFFLGHDDLWARCRLGATSLFEAIVEWLPAFSFDSSICILSLWMQHWMPSSFVCVMTSPLSSSSWQIGCRVGVLQRGRSKPLSPTAKVDLCNKFWVWPLISYCMLGSSIALWSFATSSFIDLWIS